MAEIHSGLLVEGRVFHGRYEVVRCLRAGGMGAVYEVIDQKTRRRRALKVMLPSVVTDADLRARFKLEATITGEIQSEHIVEVLDADVDAEGGAPFVVMELLRGEDLGESLSLRGTIPPGEVLDLLGQAARALDRTHAAGVVHRDLKPENLFLTQGDDGKPKVKVLDFGIAKIIAESGGPLQTTRAIGTPLYMAPEQIRGEGGIGPRADLYALAHVAFTLLTGEPYWREDSAAEPSLYAIFGRIVAGPVELATRRALRRRGVTLPPAFDTWFIRATALEPKARFETASNQIAELAEALHAGAFTPLGSSPFPRGSQPIPDFTPSSSAPLPESPSVSSVPQMQALQPAVNTMAAISGERGTPGPRRAPWLAGLGLLTGGAVVTFFFLSKPGTSDQGSGSEALVTVTAAPPASASALVAMAMVEPSTSSSAQAPPVTTTSARAPTSGAVRAGVSKSPPPARTTVTPRSSGHDPTDTR